MAIGSCTSCSTSNKYMALSEGKKTYNFYHALSPNLTSAGTPLGNAAAFVPDPSKTIDIQA